MPFYIVSRTFLDLCLARSVCCLPVFFFLFLSLFLIRIFVLLDYLQMRLRIQIHFFLCFYFLLSYWNTKVSRFMCVLVPRAKIFFSSGFFFFDLAVVLTLVSQSLYLLCITNNSFDTFFICFIFFFFFFRALFISLSGVFRTRFVIVSAASVVAAADGAVGGVLLQNESIIFSLTVPLSVDHNVEHSQ